MTRTTSRQKVTIDVGDVDIGAVEIKDASTSTRANVVTDGVNNALVVKQNSQPLPTGASTEAKQDAQAVLTGALTETAPGTDTASSGLNGRLQRIAQRLTSLIALLPASIGAKLMAGSLSVTMATDQTDIPVNRRAQTDAGGVLNATTTGGVVASLVVKANAGNLIKVKGWNNQAGTRYIQVFDATALPANGTIPLITHQVSGTSNFEFDCGEFGRPFTTGIVIATSTTATTLTVAAANILVDAQYK